jgi:ABC-2 type transport system permease protein
MLHVLATFFGPICAKEMIDMARRKRYYFNRIVYGLTLLFALYLIWEENQYRLNAGGRATIRAQAEMAQHFAITVLTLQFAAVFVFVPLFLCGVIAGEREAHTLDLLFTTCLRDRDIVLGKLASRMAALLLLILGGLPVLSLIMFFGGVDPLGLALATAATLGALLFVSAHAIYFSTISKTPTVALVRTYWWLTFELLILPYAVLLPVFAFMHEFLPRAAVIAIAEWIAALGTCVHPVGPFVVATVPDAYDVAEKAFGEWFFPFTLVVPAACSCFLIWWTIRSVHGDPRPLALRIGRFDLLRWLRNTFLGPFYRIGAALRRRGERWATRPLVAALAHWHRREVRNPLWQRSRWVRVYDREGHIGRIQWAGWFFAWLFILLIALCEPRMLWRDEGSETFLPISWIAVGGLTAIFAGGSLIGDRRRGFLDQVLLTPLSGREVIDGTLLAVWHHVRRLFWLPWLLGLFFVLTGATWPLGMLCSLVTATLFCISIALHGMLCSLSARTLPGALVPTFVFPLVVTLGDVLLLIMFERAHAVVLWLGTAIFLVGALYGVRRGFNTLAVSSYFTAMHLLLVCLATCWFWIGSAREFPGLAVNPGFWIVVCLDHRPPHWPGADVWDAWPMGLLCYWAALAIHFLWMRSWVIRNFDRLVGRTDRRPIPVPATPALEGNTAAAPIVADVLSIP